MEHALIVYITLSNHKLGLGKDRQIISLLENKISSALEDAGFGELDGDEFGEGECVIYTYGPDADMLWSIIFPFLAAELKTYKGYAIKRYGEADDPEVREERVSW